MPSSPSVLFVSSECAPFVKAGGLGDVVGALPIALRALGCDVRVVMPRYDVIPMDRLQRHPAPLGVPFGNGEAWAGVAEATLPKSDVPIYFWTTSRSSAAAISTIRPALAAHDNLHRFGFLSRGALQLCKYLGWVPDVIHVHDWPTALVPIYLNTVEAPVRSRRARPSSRFTTSRIRRSSRRAISRSANSRGASCAPIRSRTWAP